MLNCKQTSELVSQSLDKRLSWRDRIQVKIHLFICKNCARFHQQMIAIKSSLINMRTKTENNTDIQLSESSKVRMLQNIQQVAEKND